MADEAKGDLLVATVKLFNDTDHRVFVNEFRILPESLQMMWPFEKGELAAGESTPESVDWQYFNDTDVRFLVHFHDLVTDRWFRAEARPELGNHPNRPIKVRIADKLSVEHGNGVEDKDWDPCGP